MNYGRKKFYCLDLGKDCHKMSIFIAQLQYCKICDKLVHFTQQKNV